MADFARVRAIDIETTGDAKDGGRMVEIGWSDVLLHRNGEKTFPGGNSAMLNPGMPIPLVAKSIHHISDDDVKWAPTDHRPMINKVLTGADIFVAHSATYDRAFLPSVEQPWICTYRVAHRVYPDAERHGLQYLRYYAGLKLEEKRSFPTHRAGPDAYVTAMLFAKMLEQMPLARMIEVSERPVLLHRCTFGQYAGTPWADIARVHPGYLQWLTVQPWVVENEDLRFTTTQWLRGAA